MCYRQPVFFKMEIKRRISDFIKGFFSKWKL
jgi:hypothetical protein